MAIRHICFQHITLWVCLVLVAGSAEEVIGSASSVEALGSTLPAEMPMEEGLPAFLKTSQTKDANEEMSLKSGRATADENDSDLGEGMESCDTTYCRNSQSLGGVATPNSMKFYTIGKLVNPEINFRVDFELDAESDAQIALSNDVNYASGADKTYIINLQDKKNKGKSSLQGNLDGKHRSETSEAVLSKGNPVKFWIEKIGNTVRFGLAAKPALMEYAFTGSEQVHEIRYIGVRTPISTGKWTNIDVKKIDYVGKTFKFGHRDMVRAQIKGQVTFMSAFAACQGIGLYPVCYDVKTFDGQCVVVEGDYKGQEGAKGTYIYASKAAGGYPFSNPQDVAATSMDSDGETLCVVRAKASDSDFSVETFRLHRVQVKGMMTADNIVNACRVKGMKPVCDHKTASDDKCKKIGDGFFSSKEENDRTGIPSSNTLFAFFYKKATTTSRLNMGKWGDRESTPSDTMGDTFCVAADASFMKKQGIFKFNDRTLTRTVVTGEMSNANIFLACTKNSMRPICDNANEYDGLCEAIGGDWHFSDTKTTSQKGIPAEIVEGAYMYSGSDKKSRKHMKSGSRWSDSNDSDEQTLCTTIAEEPDLFEWNDWELVRVRVRATVNKASMLAACRGQNMEPVCDHFSYSDGKCRVVFAPNKGQWHFSYPDHDRANKVPVDKVKGVFFYTNSEQQGLVNTGKTHVWGPVWAANVDTLCARRPGSYLKKKNGDWVTLVPGMVVTLKGGQRGLYCHQLQGQDFKCNSNKIVKSGVFTVTKIGKEEGAFALKNNEAGKYCADEGNRIICNRNDIAQWERFHDVDLGDNRIALLGGKTGKYCADEGNGIVCNRPHVQGWEIFTVECVDQCESMGATDETKFGKFKLDGRDVERVKVANTMTSRNIFEACDARGMKPVCDTIGYFDGKCDVLQAKDGWHFSHPSHTKANVATVAQDAFAGVFMYCGKGSGDQDASLKNLKDGHRWSTEVDKNQFTLCVKPLPYESFQFQGKELLRVGVKGIMNSDNILKACESLSMSPVCDHANYNDGKCKSMENHWHFSANSHATQHGVPSKLVSWAFFYAGNSNGGKSLINTGAGSHQWTDGRETNGDTICVKRSAAYLKKNGIFEYQGRQIERTEVKGAMMSDDLFAACQKKGMRPVCDRTEYFDGRCEIVHGDVSNGQWHMSQTQQTNAQKINQDNMLNTFLYCGVANAGNSLRHGSQNHRWSIPNDKNEDTLCTLRADPSKTVIPFRFYNLYRVAVAGPMTIANILKTCQEKSMRPVCDSKADNDGKCTSVSFDKDFQWSATNIFKGLVKYAFFYSGSNGVRFNTGYASGKQDQARDGDTFCAAVDDKRYSEWKAKIGSFKVNARDITRVAVAGAMNSDNIYTACTATGLRPVCDHNAYFDGRCVVVGMHTNDGNWHMSHSSHTSQFAKEVPSEALIDVFMYCGRANGGSSLQHLQGGHRWSLNYDVNGDTLCTPADDTSKDAFTYNGFKMTRIPVKGLMTGDNILKHCEAQSMKPVCDSTTVKDSKCQALGNRWSFSNPQELKSSAKVIVPRKLQFAFFYANGNRAGVSDNNGRRWAVTGASGDRDGDTFCVKADDAWLNENGVFEFNSRVVRRIRVQGEMKSENIFNACQAQGMRPVCDHASYRDGLCENIGGQWHWSHPSHTDGNAKNVKADILIGIFAYCGTANGGLSLLHQQNDHRWSESTDTDGQTLCTKPAPKTLEKFAWRGFEFLRVTTKGDINGANIIAACKGNNMKPVCENVDIATNDCESFEGIEWANTGSVGNAGGLDLAKVTDVVFYNGNTKNAFINSGIAKLTTQAWAHDVDTLCAVKSEAFMKKSGSFKFDGFDITRVRVQGNMDSENVYQACMKRNLRPVCDHAAYFNGKCVVIGSSSNDGGQWHMSHPVHLKQYAKAIPSESVQGCFMYTNSKNTLQHLFTNSHRWSDSSKDMNGDTLCVAPRDAGLDTFHFQGFKVVRTQVNGVMNGNNILTACQKAGLKPVCDNADYKDDNCQVLGPFHMSHPAHFERFALGISKSKINGAFFYVTGNRALLNTVTSHRWSNGNDFGGDTFCVASAMDAEWVKAHATVTFNGKTVVRTVVQGEMNSKNIFTACAAKGMKPVCDHSDYADGLCVPLGGQWHFSQSKDTGKYAAQISPTTLGGLFFYCGRANAGRSLQHNSNGEYWSKSTDTNAQTLCAVTPQKKSGSLFFEYRGYKLQRVEVKVVINSVNIVSACKAVGMKPVCNAESYQDGKCIAFDSFSFSDPNQVAAAKIDNTQMENTAFYCGNSEKALINTGKTHVWSQGWETNVFTMCASKSEEWASKYATFKIDGKTVTRVQILGAPNGANIQKACFNAGMKPACDTTLTDGVCEPIGRALHMDQNLFQTKNVLEVPRESLMGTFIYSGVANNGIGYMFLPRGGYRWPNAHDADDMTLCTKGKVDSAPFVWRGYDFVRVTVVKEVNSASILAACQAKNMVPVCDHANYADGKCHNFGNSWHFSHPSHIASYAGFSNANVQNAFMYCGTANGNMALINTGNTHIWSRNWETNAETICVKPSNNFLEQYGKFAFNGFNITRTNVQGTMTSNNLWKACQAIGLRPVCDHAHYFDGRCVVVHWTETHRASEHWSHDSHSKRFAPQVPKESLQGAFMYCGVGNGQESLMAQYTGSHRWSNANDKNQQTLCTAAKKQDDDTFSYMGSNFHRIGVSGDMSGNNILEGCKAAGMQPVCNSQSTSDSNCKTVGDFQWSVLNQVRTGTSEAVMQKVKYAFFYSRGNTAHVNDGSSGNKQVNAGGANRDGDTFCVKGDAEFAKKYGVFNHNGYAVQKVNVVGPITKESIVSACRGAGMMPICNHASYADGVCELIDKRDFHWSHAPHTKDFVGLAKEYLIGTFTYTGVHGNGALYHDYGSHRWTNSNDRDAPTLCTKSLDEDKSTFEFYGYDFAHVLVKDAVNSETILKACSAQGMEPLCDHANYADGKCHNFGNVWHFSHPSHVAEYTKINNKKFQNVFFYSGTANNGKALINNARTHLWSSGWENNVNTICVKQSKDYLEKYGKFTIENNQVQVTAVDGVISSETIWNACRRQDMRPLCNSFDYFDGRCVVVNMNTNRGQWQFSMPEDAKRYATGVQPFVLQGLFMYAGSANQNRALQQLHNTHRWSTDVDRGSTLCTSAKRVRENDSFSFQAHKFVRVAVVGAMTRDSIYDACRTKGYLPVCDHDGYKTNLCKSFGSWHWSQGNSIAGNTQNAVDADKLAFAFFFTGPHGQGSLLNQGKTQSHRWSRNGDKDGDTFCVEPDQDFMKKHGLLTYAGPDGVARSIQRVVVQNAMTSSNILDACVAKGLSPVCDRQGWADGVCQVLDGNWVASGIVGFKHVFLYAGSANGQQSYFRSTGERWSTNTDMGGQTLCTNAATPSLSRFSMQGYNLQRVLVQGTVVRANLEAACAARSMKPVCDHTNWADGKCLDMYNSWHWSDFNQVRAHGVDPKLMYGVFVYPGHANNNAIVNTENGHRWSQGWEHHVDTLCGSRDPSWLSRFGQFTYDGVSIRRVTVSGHMNSDNIRNACSNLGLKPVCNHKSWKDSSCVHLNNDWHLSDPGNRNRMSSIPKESLMGVFSYCAQANGGASLLYMENTHRWSTVNDMNGDTLCTASQEPVSMGCFKDAANRDLPMFQGSRFSRDACQSMCATNGQSYFALQWDYQCFCGNSYGKHGKETSCNCPADGSTTSGNVGGWSNCVYKTKP